jgi:hypothetical protein
MKIDLGMVAVALEDHSEMEWYLDRVTGEVLPTSVDFGGAPEEIMMEIETDPDRFLLIDPMDSRDGHRIMQAFINGMVEGEASRRLARAISGRKPFASFKQALFDYPRERDAWFEFHNEHMLEEAREFLRLNEIEFDEA